jgi:hypothetical protein
VGGGGEQYTVGSDFLERLDGDGEAERDEKDCVDKRAEHLSARPTKRVLAPRLGRHSH